MTETQIKICPKCQSQMKVGRYTGPITEWEKEVEKSFIKTRSHKIATYACKKCGYLESYVERQ